MDHSMQAYLKRLPTKTLEEFLQDYLEGKFNEDFSEVIGKVVQELARRKEEKQ